MAIAHILFKIRDIHTGLFHKKGGGWDAVGDFYASRGVAQTALANCARHTRGSTYRNNPDVDFSGLEIVPFSCQEIKHG